jgi:hypothetical protein
VKKSEINEQLKRLTRDKSQKERELLIYNEELDKIMGESQTSQHIIIGRIEIKEQELIAITKKYDELTRRAEDLASFVSAQKQLTLTWKTGQLVLMCKTQWKK